MYRCSNCEDKLGYLLVIQKKAVSAHLVNGELDDEQLVWIEDTKVICPNCKYVIAGSIEEAEEFVVRD